MINPYKVLGVNEGASQEEIRAAYLKLVKKYHPDKYIDSDLKELANEKLVEVNEAYEMLTKKTSSSSSHASRDGQGSYSSYGGYTGTGNSYSGPNAAEFSRARSFINQGNLQAAKAVLDAISTRNAEWYYLYGIIYLRQGWYDKAREYITIAYQQNPGNPEYAAAYNSIRGTGGAYTRRTGNYGVYNCGSPCTMLTSALCCSSFGFPVCFCC
ncbi:MAG: DnaJ domain-containing protein [Clostridia bacterium]|nr:DnaJ domain-containing protein [Clostridia bacterium]